jgi:hypothetical protein
LKTEDNDEDDDDDDDEDKDEDEAQLSEESRNDQSKGGCLQLPAVRRGHVNYALPRLEQQRLRCPTSGP